jgi:alginate O-acetyltransferase complex protein AlgI
VLFNSIEFLVFLPVVLFVYCVLTHRFQNYWLIAASYVFYGFWDWRFLTLIFVSTVVDFTVGRAIAATEDERRRKRLLLSSLTANLGILGFFKYFGFFVDSAVELVDLLGFTVHVWTLEILLPVGISFYTFQTLSYTLDIYRRRIEPSNDFSTFALFVAYFPQLVAGPIERARNLLPRLASPRQIGWPGIAVGLELIIIGYVKKVGIADTLGPMVDVTFGNPEITGGPDLLLGAYLFSLQIYCDFSGYSDIARGVSRLFGIDLMRNFNQPYLSSSVTEFWRRWHISLSTWLRDYLYIPLGGNRHGRLRTYRNLMVTMLLGGLWHGASWTFVAWGGLHALYLAGHKLLLARQGLRYPPSENGLSIARIVKIVVTFHLVTLAWIFFRSETFPHAFSYLSGIVEWRVADQLPGLSWLSPSLLLLVGSLFAIDTWQAHRGDHAFMVSWHWVPRGLAYASLILLTLTLGNLNENVPFIYFQF